MIFNSNKSKTVSKTIPTDTSNERPSSERNADKTNKPWARWKYQESDNTLIIEGNGAIPDFSDYPPWKDIPFEAAAVSEGITRIGNKTFTNCNYVKKIILPNTVKELGVAFNGCGRLESINLPDGITQIPGHCFGSCGKLKYVSLPENLKKIGECAFMRCSSLEMMNIPMGVTEIGAAAFRDCTNLVVIMPDRKCSVDKSSFENIKELRRWKDGWNTLVM